MAASAATRATSIPDRRGLPLVVALAVGIVLLGGLAVIVAVFGYHHGAWTLGTTFRLLRVGESMALVGCAVSVLSAVLTRPPLGYRGFIASLASAITAAFIVGMMVWWHATAVRGG
jgi:hypothetical protein